MTKPFTPSSPLEDAVQRGNAPEVLRLLDAMDEATRASHRAGIAKIVRMIAKARFSFRDETHAGWGQMPDDEQRRAVTAAAVGCGCAIELADVYVDAAQLIGLGLKFGRASLEGLADAMLERQWHIRDVQELIAAGLVRRPDSEPYYLGVMTLASAHRDGPDVHGLLAADPGLREVLLRMLEVEGNTETSLAGIDKYSVKNRTSWATIFLELIQRGVYSRELLLDKCLGSLERGWIQFRSFWFSDFLGQLDPTIEEMRPHASRYLHLLDSRIPPTVTFALDAVRRLEEAGLLDAATTIEALAPVFTSSVKRQVETGLKLVDRLVKTDATLRLAAARLIVPALAHSAAEVQRQVLKRLSAWSLDAAARAPLAAYADGIAAVNRPAFDALLGEKPASAVVAAEPAPRGTPIDLASRDPLREEARLRPIADLDELVERIAYVFENDTDIDELERVLAALLRAAPFDAAAHKRFAPVAKRIGKVRMPVAQQAARLLDYLLRDARSSTAPTIDHGGHPNFAQAHLIARVNEHMQMASRTPRYVSLAEPTHRAGFIDPCELVRRLAAHREANVAPGRLDFLTALMRLAPSRGSQALREAQALGKNDVAQALRFALGEDVKVPDDELVAAATRMRRVLAGESRGPFAWRVHTERYSSGQEYSVLVIDPPPMHGTPDPVTALEAQSARYAEQQDSRWRHPASVGGIDAASIHYYATLLPGDLESFCAEGAGVLSRNLDWWEAAWQNKVYLQRLLPTHVALRPMATLTIAVALAGKEPGQTAIAVDALVQGSLGGRIDAVRLGNAVQVLIRGKQTTCARYAKSLAAALRIDPAVAGTLFTVLGAAAAANPADPAKDTAALLELMLEIAVSRSLSLTTETRAALEAMQIGGKGKALRQKLLALG